MDTLAAEVDRIVNSPYPTQLKTLYDIVLRCCEADLCLWAKCYSCRVVPLAHVLIDALPHWPYVFRLVTRMACAIPVRDAILRAEPSLLGQVVSKAINHQSGSRKYLELSVILLSHDLPHDITVPTEAQTLFIQLFEQAAAQPEVSTLQQIHRLVHGACRHFAGILSFDTLSTLEERLISIMRTLAPVKDKTPAIYCLSIMKAIVDGSETLSESYSSSGVRLEPESTACSASSSQQQWKPDSLARLFQGTRAHKTLSLITLQVIWACTPGIERSEPDASLASVEMANDIIRAIAINDREAWSKQNLPILRKLQERCLIPDISGGLRIQALIFLAAVVPVSSLPLQLISAYEQLILTFCCTSKTIKQLTPGFDFALAQSVPTLSGPFWDTLVSSILDMANTRDAIELLCFEAKLTYLLHHLAGAIEKTPQACERLLLALSSPTCRGKLEQFLICSSRADSISTAPGYCARMIENCLNSIASGFCALLLRAALSNPTNHANLPGDLMPRLLTRHAMPSRGPVNCDHCEKQCRVVRGDRLFIEVKGTPDTQQSQLPWRERISHILHGQAQGHQEALIRAFTDICRDLEERCADVEAPLNEERAKAMDYQTRLGELEKAYRERDAQIMDRDLRIGALEMENNSYSVQLERTLQETQDLLRRANEAEESLQQVNENTRNNAATLEQDKHELELKYATTIASKQEALDDAREELSQLCQEVQDLRTELKNLKERDQQSNIQHDKLKATNDELTEQIRDSHSNLARISKEKLTAIENHRDLQLELKHSLDQIVNHERHSERLQAELDDLKAETTRDMANATTSFEEMMNRTKQEWLRIKSDLEKELSEARGGLIDYENALNEQVQATKHKDTEVRKQIHRLEKECHRKDAQITEAQEMRNRLMSAMGLAGAVPATVSSTFSEPSTKSSDLPYRSASISATSKPISVPIPSETARNLVEQHHSEDEASDSWGSDTSSDCEPNLKRARPGQGLETRSTHLQRQSLGRRSAKSVLISRSATNRQPLADIDSNRSPMKDAKSSPRKGALMDQGKQGLGLSTAERKDMEDWSFSAADILTGTPGISLKKQNIRMDEASTAEL